MNTARTALAVAATGTLIVGGTITAVTAANAESGDDYPYEVTVCWEADNPPALWPQTRTDCANVPQGGEACEASKWQVDTYWIRDQDDETYLAGLNTLSSPADDRQLEPHGWYVVDVAANPELCEEEPTEPPTPTPTEPTEPPAETPPTTEPPASTGPPATRSHSFCLGNALVTKEETYLRGDWVNTGTDTVNGAARCAPDAPSPAAPGEPEPVQMVEEGM